MSRKKSIFNVIGRMFPSSLRKGLSKFLHEAGLDNKPESVLGSSVVTALVLGSLLFLVLIFATSLDFDFTNMIALHVSLALASVLSYVLLYFVSIFTGALVVFFVIYSYLLLQADARKKAIEAVLPDFLQLAAANVRAGLPIEQALWRAATPEFGVLSKEVQLAMKRTFSGESISSSLDFLASRFNSKFLWRTTNVLKFGIKSGGELGVILEKTAADLRQMQIMYKEASASMLMYVIFIAFAALIGAPLLFAVSYKLIVTLTTVWAHVPSTQNMAGGFTQFNFSAPTITPGEFYTFSILSIITTSILSSLILGVILNGNAKSGLKILPFFLIAAIIAFFLVGKAVEAVFVRNIA